MSKIQYVAYVRKSQEADERQALSLSAQRREVLALADRHGIELDGTPIEEAKSAKTPGRPAFGSVVKKIQAGKVQGLVVWHPDRLARNPLDGGLLMWLLGEGALKQIVTPGRIYTGSGDDKLMLSIIFGMATKYSDDLSANVKRGNEEAMKQGFWPGHPKLGYIREPRGRRLIPDPNRFDTVRELWNLLLCHVPVREIHEIATTKFDLKTPRHGLKGGRHFSRSKLHAMFRDPFYAGLMVRAGNTYPGNHRQMVSSAEFQRAQAILDGRNDKGPRPKSRTFAYRGVLGCGECAGPLTAKVTVNRHGTEYQHYYCPRKRKTSRACRQGAVREEDVDRQFLAFLSDLSNPSPFLTEVERMLIEMEGRATEQRSHREEREKGQLKSIDRRLERLRELLVDDVISEDDYAADRQRLLLDRRRLEERTQGVGEAILEPFRLACSLLRSAPKILEDASPLEKRDLANLLMVDPRIRDKKLLCTAKKPFAAMGTTPEQTLVCGQRDDVETCVRAIAESLRTFHIPDWLHSKLKAS